MYEQYLIYMGKVLRGDLGTSILRGDPVTQDILRRFPATVELALAAILVALVVGVPAGIISAVWRNSVFDNVSRLVALTGVSMPIFWLGLMLAWLFGVILGWLPTGGPMSTESSFTYEPITQLVRAGQHPQRQLAAAGRSPAPPRSCRPWPWPPSPWPSSPA